jgi:hypothetical protein
VEVMILPPKNRHGRHFAGSPPHHLRMCQIPHTPCSHHLKAIPESGSGVSEPYGTFTQSRRIVKSGSFAMVLTYAFPTGANRYVVFRHRRPLPLPRHSHTITLWVYGDNSSNLIKLWLKGQDGAIVQVAVAPVGVTGWHQIHVNLPPRFDAWDRIGARRWHFA